MCDQVSPRDEPLLWIQPLADTKHQVAALNPQPHFTVQRSVLECDDCNTEGMGHS